MLQQTNIHRLKKIILSVFNKYPPIKKNISEQMRHLFWQKNVHKEIMKRSRLRNKYLKSESLTNRKKYNIQRNFCKKLLTTNKNQYFNYLDNNKVTDNRTFWIIAWALTFQTSSEVIKRYHHIVLLFLR